jgi:DNA-directed RNA polymerase subunit N (RpoN/RPB10)
MMFPIRCFSCGKPIGHLWERYKQLLGSGKSEAEALDTLGITRYCCRRMFISHTEIIESFLEFHAQLRQGGTG